MHNMCVRTRQMISAIERSDLACVEAEISCDADPTFGVDAAISKLEPKALRLLLHKGADLRYLEFGKRQASLLEAITADACLMMVAEEGFASAVGSILRLRSSANTIEGRDGKIFLTNLIRQRRTPILKMLLDKGVFSREFVADSSEWSLPVAAKSSVHLYILLQNFGARFSTALFGAVTANILTDMKSLEIAGIYLKYGASPEIHTERGDLFTTAKENMYSVFTKATSPCNPGVLVPANHWSYRYLSFCGKDTPLETYISEDGSLTALPSHWNLSSLEPHYQPISPLIKGASVPIRTMSKMTDFNLPEPDEKSLNEIRLLCLHREFQKEHTHILACAQSSVAGNPRAWGQYGFMRNYSFAWRSGMATVHVLRRRETTSNLNSAIWFLAIAKARLVTDKISPTGWQVQFMSDLNRYRGLFSQSDGSLDAFRSAAQDIWGASLTYPPHHDGVDQTALMYFQSLAGSLLDGSESPLRHRGNSDHGILTSQRRWRMHQPSKLGKKDGYPNPFHERLPESLVEQGDPADYYASGSTDFHEGGTGQEYASDSPFRDTRNGPPYVSAHYTVALTIMAGFIFGVVLALLLGKILISSMAYLR